MKDIKSLKSSFDGVQRYTKIRLLHVSPDGVYVELCKNVVTNELVAIKFIERGSLVSSDLKRGVINFMGLHHHHIVSFKEVFLTLTHLCIVMEYAAGGDLLQFSKQRRLSEGQARWFFQQLILGLDYCHKMGIVSRNISLENTLIDDSPWPLLKINAFTKSTRLSFNDSQYYDDACTNIAYLPPELLTGKGIRKEEYKKVDVWSCGVFLYTMLFQQYPFYNPAEATKNREVFKQALKRTMECKFDYPDSIKISEECRDLMNHILTPRKTRISLEDIMQHPWFQKDLPKGAMQMNKTMRLRKSTKLQTKEEIINVIDEAHFCDLCSE